MRTSFASSAPPDALERPPESLTSGRLLARNVAWNLVGNGAPLVVALPCIPLLIAGLGTERFGVLTLAWALIGYFSLFDLGLGRALTKLVAEKLGTGRESEIAALVKTSLLFMLGLGFAGGVILALVSPSLVRQGLRIPEALQRETLFSFYLLSISVPVVISTAALRGVLEAKQRFGLVNAIRIPMGVFTFVGPLLVLPFSRSLLPVVAVLLAGRVVAWAIHLGMCFRVLPQLRARVRVQRAEVGPLFRFGGWMTVTNIVGPLMVSFDRFLIGALASIAAVAYYATPYEVVTKLLLIPGALAGVLFPAFSTSFASNPDRTAALFDRGFRYVLLALFPAVLLIIVFAQEGLMLWLGSEFASQSARVLQWLSVGVFINSLGYIPFALLQGVGRPHTTAKLHLVEMPFYFLILWWMVSSHGIVGAAVAWTARVVVDTFALLALSRGLFRDRDSVVRRALVFAGVALVLLALATMPSGVVAKSLFAFVTLVAFAVVAWLVVLTPKERTYVHNYLKPSHAFD